MASTFLADLAMPVPLPRALTYLVPEALRGRIAVGDRVLATVGARRLVGVVVALREGEPPPKAKALVSLVDGASLPPDLVDFLRRVAAYYLAPIGETVRLALPPMDKATARAVEAPTLFSEARGIAPRKVQWVEAGSALDVKVPPRSELLVAQVRAEGAIPLARLEERFGGARSSVKKLSALGLVQLVEREAPTDPFFAEPVARDAPPVLTDPQRRAVEAIDEALEARASKTFLLDGVTGSGKTEVYLHAIAKARALGHGAIMLVPEIALTPQLVGRFRARFGDDVAVLHSGLTPSERYRMWQRLRAGELEVAIGARSALFAPVRGLGLILVDEEHDGSFKQEEGVRYHARDMAILRAHLSSAVVVLGSATPSLESEHMVRTDKAVRLALPARARAQAMPRVEIVDLRCVGAGPTGDKRLSITLHRALEETLAMGEQAIVFLNRRGFSPSVRCEGCGTLVECKDCSVALTFHKRRRHRDDRGELPDLDGTLRCHYCDFASAMIPACPACKCDRLALEGLGTEKLEETLALAFPAARIARLDRDVARGKDIERVLDAVRAREVDILVGTQMVTKGHDLPHVTLVGVINADAAISLPDFRAAERAFQLMVQVAGRAGRGDRPGRVLIQTYDPEHAAIARAVHHDVRGFVEHELRDRAELSYPPWTRIVLARIEATEEPAAQAAAAALAEAARSVVGIDVRGPAPAPIARLRGRYRYRVLIRSKDREKLRDGAYRMVAAIAALPRDVRAVLDVDPVQFL